MTEGDQLNRTTSKLQELDDLIDQAKKIGAGNPDQDAILLSLNTLRDDLEMSQELSADDLAAIDYRILAAVSTKSSSACAIPVTPLQQRGAGQGTTFEE